MSKLGALTGSTKQDRSSISSAVGSLMGNGYTKIPYTKIPLNQICVRFRNYYIDDKKTFASLCADIRENGLQQPIVVVEIDFWLKSKSEEMSEDEIAYYTEKRKNGILYFVSSGHRRFKAFVSLYIGRKQISDSEMNDMYSNFGTPKFNDAYSEITCSIMKESGNEAGIYNGTNLTSRPVTNWEFVVSYLTDSNVDPEERGYINRIHDVIYDRYGVSISSSLISDYVRIFTTFDRRLLDMIFDGTLKISSAQKLLPIYETAIADSELFDDIRSGNLRISKYTVKKKKTRAVTYSKKDVLEMLYRIRKNPEELDVMIGKLKG